MAFQPSIPSPSYFPYVNHCSAPSRLPTVTEVGRARTLQKWCVWRYMCALVKGIVCSIARLARRVIVALAESRSIHMRQAVVVSRRRWPQIHRRVWKSSTWSHLLETKCTKSKSSAKRHKLTKLRKFTDKSLCMPAAPLSTHIPFVALRLGKPKTESELRARGRCNKSALSTGPIGEAIIFFFACKRRALLF